MGLETPPARMLAWTLQNYGAYVVDTTGWNVYAVATEHGPDGSVAEEFEQDWGFSMTPQSRNNPWSRDMDRLFGSLHAVDNNGPTSVGGGGAPVQPLAPALDEPGTTQPSCSALDLDGTGMIDFGELVALLRSWAAIPGSPAWDARVDWTGDGYVGFGEFLLLINAWGSRC
jgi:hypothetical protein